MENINNLEKLKEKLLLIVDNIKEQYITLNELKFEKEKNLINIKPKKVRLEHNLVQEINSGEILNDDNEKFPYISIAYRLIEKIYIDDEENPIVNNTIEYVLHIILKPKEEIYRIIKDKNVLEKYAKGTGILTVFPYIRHMANFLHKEAGIDIPPYPPMKI